MNHAQTQILYPIEILHSGRLALACGLDGQIVTEELNGLFSEDTRLLSTYRILIGNHTWKLLGRNRWHSNKLQWEFQNTEIHSPMEHVPEASLWLSLVRTIADSMVDEFRIVSFAQRRIRARFSLQLDSDFSDIFEVKDGTHHLRFSILRLESRPHGEGSIKLLFRNRNFERSLEIRLGFPGISPQFVGNFVIFDLDLSPGDEWSGTVEFIPSVTKVSVIGSSPKDAQKDSQIGLTALEAPEILKLPFDQGRRDLKALTVLSDFHETYFAAGVPWFLTLFGRDSLVTSLMSGIIPGNTLEGTLEILQRLQAHARDDWHDAETGKFPHETREGELASTGQIPHSCYYGAHDIPALYCLGLWNLWRWSANRNLIQKYLPTALLGLEWCEKMGDRDGDGFQEYGTRSTRGYRNQGWKDAEDAIVHADGSQPPLPIGTVELQGYWYGAYLAMAELLEEFGTPDEAQLLREKAKDLALRVESSFWIEEEGFYGLAIDGNKKLAASISSNPAHLLWMGVPSQERAAAVTRRLLTPELFTGWGIRTLSDRNRAYNPLLYQRGSVWPHDSALAAAGMWRYGFKEEASLVLKGILEAACSFESGRLPELFAGLQRQAGPPVPYEKANSPQAWAAAVPVLAVQLFLGLVPDMPKKRCFLSPELPEWLPYLELNEIPIGQHKLSLRLRRVKSRTEIEKLSADGIDVQFEIPEAPLWGKPLKSWQIKKDS